MRNVKSAQRRKLSVCIPTYNFGQFIADAITSILEQDGAEDIELIILDGASTDNTSEVIERLRKKYKQISYHREGKKGGIDVDIAKVVALAKSEYCWLFSADDVMRAGALRLILSEIAGGHDVYLGPYYECAFDLKPIREWPLLNSKHDRLFDLSCGKDRIEYFVRAENTVAFFSFMSGLIIKKSTWDSGNDFSDFVGSYYAHAARLFSIAQNGLTIKYIATPLVDRRGENDSFVDRGIVNRFRITVDGYNRLADAYFGHESVEAFHIRRAIRSDLGFAEFAFAKYRCGLNPGGEDGAALASLFARTVVDLPFGGAFARLAYHLMPDAPWIVMPLRKIRHALQGF
jgi:abequosyltransferase